MAIFNQVTLPEKSGQTLVRLEVLEEEREESSSSSILDASFRKELKQARYSVRLSFVKKKLIFY